MFVDAGYLLAAGGWATVGTWKRGEAVADISGLVSWLKEQAGAESGQREVLRLYWYDAAARKEPTPEQREVARQADTKLRLGSLNRFGHQKGVDALLLGDMMDLAYSRSVDLAFLVSGDEDLVEAVTRVQAAGIRLYLWGVDSPRNTLSVELRHEADRCRLLTGTELKPFFSAIEVPGPPEVAWTPPLAPDPRPGVRPRWEILRRDSAVSTEAVTVNGIPPTTYAVVDLEQVADEARRFARSWLEAASPADLDELRRSHRPVIPYQIDARLLTTTCRSLGISPDDQLDFDARIALRNGFWDEVERAAASEGERAVASEVAPPGPE